MLLDAFLTGVRDSVNPFALALILLFLLAVYLWAFTLKRVLVFCGFTFLGIVASQIVLFNGLWQETIKSEFFWQTLKLSCLVISIILICVGIINFLDWVRLKKGVSSSNLLLKFSCPVQFKVDKAELIANFSGESHGFVWMFFMAVFCLFIGVVMGTALFIWPQSYYIYLLAIDALSNMSQKASFLVAVCYACAIGLPYIFVAVSRMPQVCSSSAVGFCLRYLSTIKIVLSAIFLAMGLVLGAFDFK